ncbi:MAG: hypothetical protein HYS07_05385 [Chlamydiae bacterium]|nr:hypothetical protein [Chlamydiota bacterium]MBI3278020.1 hypothetical protein [Chlamydiota bacterium]
MKFRDWIIRDFAIKIWSIILSIIVWVMVQGEITTKRVFHDISYHLEVAPSMVVVKRGIQRIRMVLAGPQDVMRDTMEDSIQVMHDLKGIKTPGVVQFTLSDEDFTIPGHTQILEIFPNQLSITLDRLVEKELKVKANFIGKPEKGFYLKDFVVSPAIVRVEGPKARLESLSEIETQPILLTGRSRSFAQTISLKPILNSEDRRSDVQPVDIYVKIDQEMSRKKFNHVPVALLYGLKDHLATHILNPQIEVSLEGGSELMGKLSDSDLKAFVDVTDLKPGKYQLPVNVIPVKGLNIVGIQPQSIEVEILGELEATA